MRPKQPLPVLAGPVEALLQGDTGLFLALIDSLSDWPLLEVERAWWELSTLCGAVVDHVAARAGEQIIPYALKLRPIHMTGGPPHELADPEALARDWRAALAVPPTRELHRANIKGTLAAQRADRHDQPDAADCLLRHHTDLPVDMFTGRHPVGPEYGRVGSMAAQQLTDLDAVLASSDAFASHLQAGLASSSLPRCDLAWRLLQLAA
jgi:hypothetical protein